ncbi:MAG: hypothetical protein RMY29_006715 [Nostoc sp. CreGUA01]
MGRWGGGGMGRWGGGEKILLRTPVRAGLLKDFVAKSDSGSTRPYYT